MNFFSKIFNQNDAKSINSSDHYIKTPNQWQHLFETSKEKAVIVFKHSERCSISRWVWKQFEQAYDISENLATLHLVDVVSDREISQGIATDLNILHQSPQVLVIYNKKCLYHASHESIQFDHVKRLIETLTA
jgi:bacillithiol system protein YtxJ